MKTRLTTMLISALFALCLASCASHQGALRSGHVADGNALAADLNARFEDLRMRCDGEKAAYFCNGVVIRVVSIGDDHVWNPDPTAPVGAISFSYLRRDVGSRFLYGMSGPYNDVAGFLMYPADRWGKDGYYAVHVSCVFTYNAQSDTRPPNGCGESTSYPVVSGPCFAQGIVTVDAWIKHYRSLTWPRRMAHQCSFGTDAFSFELSILSRVGWEDEEPSGQHNELVVQPWPRDIPAELPIQAIFFSADVGDPKALEDARAIQKDMLESARIQMPIVRYTRDLEREPFSYHAEDQIAPAR